MKLKRKVSVCGLGDFGLSLRELIALKDRMIKVRVHCAYGEQEPLFPFSPDIRRKKMDVVKGDLFFKLRGIWPSKGYTVIGSKKRPSGISGTIRATDIRKFTNKDFVHDIWIEEIEGIRKLKLRKEKSWFAVKALFAIQIEGQTKGFQEVEECIVIVSAFDCKDAEKMLIKDFKKYDDPYLNKYGEMVRWHFEKVVDVYDMNVDTIDPKGTEVFYEFIRRRMKPEYEWHPLKEIKKQKHGV